MLVDDVRNITSLRRLLHTKVWPTKLEPYIFAVTAAIWWVSSPKQENQ